MENLNNVPSTGTFGGSVSKINSNFDLVVNAINSLEYQTTRSKGILNYGQNPATVFPNAVAGDWCMILSQGNVFPATIKTYNGSKWSGSGTWNPEGVDLTQYAQKSEMTTAIANSLAQATARMGYGECTVSGTTLAVSIPNFILPTSGGTIHIKMSAAGTGASTLSINGTTAKTLWYNGAAVSAQNTWEANEIVSVFYDGTKYMASNSQGGGGKAEKIKYNNSKSGLAAENVQGALDEVVNDLYTQYDVNFIANTTSIGWSISTIDGKWLKSSACRILAIEQNNIYKITAGEKAANYTLLESSTPVAKQVATDYNGGIPINIAAGESVTINSGKYKYLYCRFLNGTFANPKSVEKYMALDEFVGKNTQTIDISNLCEMRGLIRISDGVWIYDANAKFSIIDIMAYAGGQMCITSGEIEFVVAFLTQKTYAYGSLANLVPNTTLIGGSGKVYKDVPANARYMYISTANTSGEDRTPTSIEVYGGYYKSPTVPEYWEIVRKKIHHYTNLVWTSLGKIGGSNTYCNAGVKTGMLYGSSVQVDRYVGFDITLKTFMTLANNPYSLLYTDSPGNRHSGYGFNYVRTEGSKAWAGTVCSRFVLNCLGSPLEWETAHFKYLCQVGTLIKSKSQIAKDVQIGDLIWISGHTRMIYDVVKTGNIVNSIVVCEAVSTAGSPLVVSVKYTPSTLDAYMSENSGIFYKWNGKRGMVYEPTEFVNNYDEPLPDDYVYNDDICTYAGDYAAFRVGYPVYLNYNLKAVGDWTQIQLYKGDTLVNTYSIDSSEHRLQIPAADIVESGFYKARMTDGSNYSDYTYFEIIEAFVTVTTPDAEEPATKKVEYSSANGYPVAVVVCNNAGGPYGRVPLTMKDVTRGYITIDVERICLVQLGIQLDSSVRYIKVYFKGEYGRISSELINFDL